MQQNREYMARQINVYLIHCSKSDKRLKFYSKEFDRIYYCSFDALLRHTRILVGYGYILRVYGKRVISVKEQCPDFCRAKVIQWRSLSAIGKAELNMGVLGMRTVRINYDNIVLSFGDYPKYRRLTVGEEVMLTVTPCAVHGMHSSNVMQADQWGVCLIFYGYIT